MRLYVNDEPDAGLADGALVYHPHRASVALTVVFDDAQLPPLRLTAHRAGQLGVQTLPADASSK